MNSDLNTDFSDEEKSKQGRKVRAAKKLDSETDSDSEIIESVLKPFPAIETNKAIKTTKTIENNTCKNVQYVDNSHVASPSSSVQLDNYILFSDLPTESKSQKRDATSEIAMKKKKK